MINPVTELLRWVKGQDKDVQIDIAFLMSGFHPSFNHNDYLGLEPDELMQKFYERIADFQGTQYRNSGFIIAFRAIFDFTIASKRGTADGWMPKQHLMQSVLDSTDPNTQSSLKENAKKILRELPARRDQWIAVCNGWQALKDSSLSDRVIEEWENNNFLCSTKHVDI